MDHKRGYDHLNSDHGAPSPPKRRKDLSHQCPVPPPVPQLGTERYNAQVNRSQYKTQIQYGCPQPGGHGSSPPIHAPQPSQAHAKDPEPIPGLPTRTRPRVWVDGPRGSDLWKKIEEEEYQSLLPIVKKELEKWAFFSDRAPKRVPPLCDVKDDETTCAVCRDSRKFKGWDALVIHAQKYSKYMPWQHRGYHRALQEALFEKTAVADAENPKVQHSEDRAVSELCGDIRHMKMNPEHLKHSNAWRPDILIVENDEFHEVDQILGKQRQKADPKPQLREILAVYSHGDGDQEQRHVFVYPASKVAYVEETGSNNFRQSGVRNSSSRHLEETNCNAGVKVSDVPRVTLPSPNYDTVARCASLKEALGLQLTLDDPDDTTGKKLFDLEQIHPTNSVVDRWTENFKSSAKRFESQRAFRDPPTLVAIDEGFRADLRRIKTYSPGCKHKIKDQMAKIEERLQENHLIALQQVDEVREQFQELADGMHHQEARDQFMAMRAGKKKTARQDQEKQEAQHAALREALAKASLMVRRRKAEQRQEKVQMMQLWMEDAKLFKQESTRAKEERRRLETIHGKVHDRAKQARKDCPVCSESFRLRAQLVTSSG